MLRPDNIIRSNRKTLAVCIDNFGNVIVRAPKKLAEKHIYAFLDEKRAWIEKKQAEKTRFDMQLPPDNLDGYTFFLLGERCTIRLHEKNKVAYNEQEKTLFLPKENARCRLVKWLKENAKRIFTAVTEKKAEEMGVTFQCVGVSSAKTRWGTCTADNKIRYTFRLLYMPKDIIEYVVVHELAHTKYKNHAQLFWREVERYIPDWKARRKRLKERGALMEIF